MAGRKLRAWNSIKGRKKNSNRKGMWWNKESQLDRQWMKLIKEQKFSCPVCGRAVRFSTTCSKLAVSKLHLSLSLWNAATVSLPKPLRLFVCFFFVCIKREVRATLLPYMLFASSSSTKYVKATLWVVKKTWKEPKEQENLCQLSSRFQTLQIKCWRDRNLYLALVSLNFLCC